ncbi:unnamed protein product [Caenorhabditis auriculariae]|uniref:Uncharacterized protein n=1 Tax=Caenorhabditis auriculariae TaxID=2777116 RepID=A0A8S1H4C2_9PELO|nr:unnamed protein product [Caenorhabditis auriculariae]
MSARVGDDPQNKSIDGVKNFRRRLGTEMTEILPLLYLGSLRDAHDPEQLEKFKIRAILSVHDMPRTSELHQGMTIMQIRISDSSAQRISVHFRDAIQFIHEARMRGDAVLVHCLAGVSRSVALVAAYVCTTLFVVDNFRVLSFIQSRRPVANPNFGFRMQLANFFAKDSPRLERQRLLSSGGKLCADLFKADKVYFANGR